MSDTITRADPIKAPTKTVRGRVVTASDPGCEAARAVCDAVHDRRPRAVVSDKLFPRQPDHRSSGAEVNAMTGLAQTAQVDWYIEGVEVSNCNCDYGCPCQFESPQPTYGHCRGFAAVRIDTGHFGDVPLDGLCGALLYAWPGPIYEGGGECQAVIDERADSKQRDALATVLYGGETDEGATHWWVYTTMSSTVHPPIFKRFEFEADIDGRAARVVIPDVLHSTARPIRSPATGAEHHVRIDLPNGIEFERAEVGSGTTTTTASIALDLADTYCHLVALRQSGKGVVRGG